ncbi:uncharacterized protein PV06_10081 [Exophiala oligosperma]|uniref:Uncharacterized protein n=1 Tax=Exophiala oligosperma TaxID=215243 RepID=A0A0D2D6U7_9EURO|nr:uncharacterized protein PV06_10081 [Exophiala oligosperma]KIW38120.1 hypothetical protein PV06_10081 [Exophiala oligosperma]
MENCSYSAEFNRVPRSIAELSDEELEQVQLARKTVFSRSSSVSRAPVLCLDAGDYLLSHFFNNVYLTLFFDCIRIDHDVWLSQVQEIINTCQFARQAVMSVSAINLCLVGGPTQTPGYDDLAYGYAISGSELFRSCVTDITPQNGWQTVVFAVLSAIIALCAPFICSGNRDEGLSETERLRPADFVLLLRSTHGIVPAMDCLFQEPAFGEWLPDGIDDTVLDTNPAFTLVKKDTIESLDSLRRRLAVWAGSRTLSTEVVSQYEETISALRDWIWSLSTMPPNWKSLTVWPSKIPVSYIDRLQKRCPIALGILDTWCSIVKQIPERWYFKPWLDAIHSMALIECPRTVASLEADFVVAED